MGREKRVQSVDLALILGYIATKDVATIEKKIEVLTQLGYSNEEMAKICGARKGTIKTLKSKIKKEG